MVVSQAASAPYIANTVMANTVAPDTVSAYWQFHQAVAQAQLAAWLPRGQRLLIDVSGPHATSAEQAAKAGHTVVRVLDDPAGAPARQPGGRLRTLIGDTSRLGFLPDGCADGVIAGDRTLSTHLAAETMVTEIARVLRPAGRVLASVDSLVLGMAVLADQHRWAHLVDLPHAEVVLVPWPDGTITRCYGPDQLRELVTGAGLTVSWMRPLTVFSESMVTHLLQQDPDSMPRLVRAELGARSDESLGAQLVVSAYKPELAPPAGVLGLAGHASCRVRAGLQPPLRYLMAAVDAVSVPALLDTLQRGQHPVALPPGRLQDRLGPVILGQARARIGRILRIAIGRL